MMNPVAAVAASGGDLARAALAAGLVDKLADREQFEARLARARRRARIRPRAIRRSSSATMSATLVPTTTRRLDRRRHRRRHDRRRRGFGREPPAATASPTDRQGGAPTAGSRRWSCGSTARAARCSPPSGSASRCSTPSRRSCRSWCRWAASPRRAAIGSRPRPTSSLPSRRRSPGRSACSASSQASRDRCRSSESAPTGSRRRRCRASPICSAAPRPRSTGCSRRGSIRSTASSSPSSPSRASKTPQRDRPDRPGARVGRRHCAPARAGRRLRRAGRSESPRPAQLAKVDDAADQVRYLEPPKSFEEELVDMLAGERSAGRSRLPDAVRLRCRRQRCASATPLPSCARSCRARASRRAASNARPVAPGADAGKRRQAFPDCSARCCRDALIRRRRLTVSGSSASASMVVTNANQAEADDQRVVRILAGLEVHDVKAPHPVVEAPQAGAPGDDLARFARRRRNGCRRPSRTCQAAIGRRKSIGGLAGSVRVTAATVALPRVARHHFARPRRRPTSGGSQRAGRGIGKAASCRRAIATTQRGPAARCSSVSDASDTLERRRRRAARGSCSGGWRRRSRSVAAHFLDRPRDHHQAGHRPEQHRQADDPAEPDVPAAKPGPAVARPLAPRCGSACR